jgi:hypothetical protein
MALHHLAAALALAACAPAGRAIVTEVYYDAPGDDTGREFVELFNPFGRACSLAGAKLEAGDGSAAGRWTVRWTGGVADSVPAFGRFVVGGALVSPAPNAVAPLDLQNGPDALRVSWPDGVQEVVGWGVHDFAEYACGAPGPDVASGYSLARVPDDADFGSNAFDFRSATPSPGRANQNTRDAAVVGATLAASPERPEPGEALLVSLRVANTGRTAFAAGEAALVLAGDALAESLAIALPAFGAGETLAVARGAPAGEAGRRALLARVVLAGDEAPANDADTLALRVGAGPLEATEVQFHPGAGEGEWVEVRNRSGAPLALSAFTLADRASAGARLVTVAMLAPDSLAVLAQDRAALLAAFPGLDTARVVAAAPWASLNNSDDSTGVADMVVLRGTDGLLVERVAYSSAGVPAGTPLEKRGGLWGPASATRGTPLAFPAERGRDAAAFALAPRRLRAGERDLQLAWSLPWPRGKVTVELYDLSGRRATRLLDEVASGPSDSRRVVLGEVAPGVYVAVLRAHDGPRTVTHQALLRVGGVRP